MVKTRQQRPRSSLSTEANILQTFGPCYTSQLDPISGKTQIRCGFKDCSYMTDKNSNFKRHLETMHQLLQPPVTCCQISFLTKGEYRFHTRSIHRNGHQCSTCRKVFNRKALLERHTAIHTGSKPFSCTFCEYASANKANVIRHLPTHGSSLQVSVAITELQAQNQSPPSSSFSSPATPTPTNLASITTPMASSLGQNEPNPVVSLPSASASSRSSSSTCTASSPSPSISTSTTPMPQESCAEKLNISHSIESILAKSQGARNDTRMSFNPETLLPGKENQLKTNDYANARTNPIPSNWSQLSSREEEGLALQLQLQEYKYNSNHYYQQQQQQQIFYPQQLPFYPGGGGGGPHLFNYNYYNQNEVMNAYQYQQYQQYQHDMMAAAATYHNNQGLYYLERQRNGEMTAMAGGGGDLDLLPQETRHIDVPPTHPPQQSHSQPDFLSQGLKKKAKNTRRKGAVAGIKGNQSLVQQDIAINKSEGPAQVALFVKQVKQETQNHCDIDMIDNRTSDSGVYIPKKMRLSKKFEKC